MVPQIRSTKHSRQDFFPFTPLTTKKIKILKKCKTMPGDKISSFATNVPKIMIIRYTVPEIWHMMDELLFFILGYFLPSNSPKNQNSIYIYTHIINRLIYPWHSSNYELHKTKTNAQN